jgi:REP element-mobilizing transposase RayT
LFGDVLDGKMVLNEAGKMIHKLWYQIMDDFSNVYLHEFVIMPNHIHGIIEITNNPVGADSISALEPMDTYKSIDDIESKIMITESQRADMESAPTLGKIVQSFKRHTTIQYIQMVKTGNLPRFNKRIWQRNYYEHVVRDDVDFERIATYIINNPATWHKGTLNT